MPADAKCTPGQGTDAVVPVPISIQPISGNFGTAQGAVRLVSNKDSRKSAYMDIKTWGPDVIVATPPAQNPGTGAADETFKVEVRVNNDVTHIATPVRVTGAPTGGYPPAHPPAH